MKRFLVFMIVLALIPVFMGLYCPCAQASALEAGFHKAPCHGCCPEIAAAPDTPAEFISQKFLTQPTDFQKLFASQLKAQRPGMFRESALSRRDLFPAAGEPSPLLQEPLYLDLRVLRL